MLVSLSLGRFPQRRRTGWKTDSARKTRRQYLRFQIARTMKVAKPLTQLMAEMSRIQALSCDQDLNPGCSATTLSQIAAGVAAAFENDEAKAEPTAVSVVSVENRRLLWKDPQIPGVAMWTPPGQPTLSYPRPAGA